jgi:hypothetical protein
MPNCLTTLLTWPKKRWAVMVMTSLITALLIGIPTAIIPTPIFGRVVAVTSWSVPVLIVTSILTGLLFASYVKTEETNQEERSLKVGSFGGFLSFLAVGCPVCNKVALIALGSSGAIRIFAPMQPYFALVGIALLFYAVRKRILSESMCSVSFMNFSNKSK